MKMKDLDCIPYIFGFETETIDTQMTDLLKSFPELIYDENFDENFDEDFDEDLDEDIEHFLNSSSHEE